MRRLAAGLLAVACVAGSLGCPAKPSHEEAKGGAVVQPKSYEVRKGSRLVLSVIDKPGPIVSTAVRPPDGSPPPNHPFLSASAHAPEEEDALRTLLEASKDLNDFLERLRKAGYAVSERR